MSDLKVKIVSNPYSKTIEFAHWDNGWTPVDTFTEPNSKLLNKALVSGFFPFKAKDIVEQIVNEYGANNAAVSIVFEGSEDEFEELAAVCNSDSFKDSVALERGSRYLANARDILPEIIDVFKIVRPLVDESVMESAKIADELKKFYDVSSDLIPLCVLGNYSAGKSTFINALIGHELLPSGDMPVTARVFQIKRSKQRDRASIKIVLGGEDVVLKFDTDGLQANGKLQTCALCDRIAAIANSNLEGMIAQMNETLRIVNSYRPKDDDATISDLVEIEVPFCQDDPWALSNEFVIFDTPGSNSASNEDHIRVLRGAMEGLSNGLPIYIAEYSSLDSTDNKKLYEEIKQIEAMDERFAMIVVNKADAADLPKRGFSEFDTDQIMDMAIPRNLYAQGIYFVSSVLGLGSKTSGHFVDDNYAEKYEDQVRKYSDPSERFYKTLYKYNILPEQIRERAVAESAACPNLILANCGLYCVEQEIDLFAERYSAYNKCHQSEALLGRIIDVTSSEIAKAKERREEAKRNREEMLDRDKKRLIEDLEAAGTKIEDETTVRYPDAISAHVNVEQWHIAPEALSDREIVLTRENQEERHLDDQNAEAKDAQKAIGENLGKNMGEFLTNFDIGALRDAAKKFGEDVSEAQARRRKAMEMGRDADRETSDELLSEVRARFDNTQEIIESTIDKLSQEFWESEAEKGRTALYNLATNSSVLSEEKRKEVADIIIRYPSLKLAFNADAIFVKSNLDMSFRLWDVVIIQSNKLNLKKLARVFNSESDRVLEETREAIKNSHELSFKEWLNALLNKIISNIIDYNPILHAQAEIISEEISKINELTARMDTLERCTGHISQLIDWKEQE